MNIITVSDNPLTTSGVAQQMQLLIRNFVEDKENKIVSLTLDPCEPMPVTENWMVAYLGKTNKEKQESLLSTLKEAKNDYVIFMTDPRHFMWLSEIEYEMKKYSSNLIYYHVWDSTPAPEFNQSFYDIFDHIACISQLTFKNMKQLGYKNISYVPHTAPDEIFKLPVEQVKRFSPRFTVLWDSRNMFRKAPACAIEAFSIFHKNHPESFLVMKTDPILAEGCDVQYLMSHFGLKPMEDCILIGEQLSPEHMNAIYNASDVVLSTSLAEGFGLSALTALKTGTPVIAPEIGGLQDQVDSNVGFAVKPDFTFNFATTAAPLMNYHFVKPQTYAKFLEHMFYFSKERKEKFSNNCIEKYNKNFSKDIFNNNWNNIIKREYVPRNLNFKNYVNVEVI